MSPLVKKELRLIRPSAITALVLVLLPTAGWAFKVHVEWLMIFGLTLMALSPIGREISLNTFSGLLSQPAQRIRIWNVKLSALAAAFIPILLVWYVVAFSGMQSNATDWENNVRNLVLGSALIAMATFTGGLWTTLLLRQVASAFWFTLLVPIVLCALSGIFLADSESSALVIAVLSVVLGIYSLGGFLLARWLFFHAQDIGWSGGTITLPEWSLRPASATADSGSRSRKPVFALLKKEVQLCQGVLMGGAALLALHLGVVLFRSFHTFPRNSVGATLTPIIWMLWWILSALVGTVAVAEERKLGVTESQMCLPASRRRQYFIKLFVILALGIFLGGLMPALVEGLGLWLGAKNSLFLQLHHYQDWLGVFYICGSVAFSATLGCFFASSLAKNFLQAIGIALVTFTALAMCLPAFVNNRSIFYDAIAPGSILPGLVASVTIPVALVWLAYLNYKTFREGWPLWRRNVLGAMGTVLFIGVFSSALYHRVWEVFEPAEPPHGPARFTRSNPWILRSVGAGNILVRLPDGRVWFDYLTSDNWSNWPILGTLFPSQMRSAGPQSFLSGSKWVAATAAHINQFIKAPANDTNGDYTVTGYADSVGIQPDGTLWVSGTTETNAWTANQLAPFGNAHDWIKLASRPGFTPILLLKTNGTLWLWGPSHFNPRTQTWPGLRSFQPHQVGTDTDWNDIDFKGWYLAQKSDGTVWHLAPGQNDSNHMAPDANDSPIPFSSVRAGDSGRGVYVRGNGTLWFYFLSGRGKGESIQTRQFGTDTNWVMAVGSWDWMVALKTDGTLWHSSTAKFPLLPRRLGINKDWMAVTSVEDNAVALAADGSLWLWPAGDTYQYRGALLELPKRPKFLGNVFQPIH